MNWQSLGNSVEKWAKALDDIQTEASAALKSGKSADIKKAKKSAQDFIKHSPALISGMSELDRLATDTIIDLNNAEIATALGNIEARTAEIAVLTKQIEKVTAEANRAAKSITLENVTALIDQLTSVVSQAKKLKQNLDENGLNTDIVDDIDGIVKAAGELFPKLRALQDS